MARWRPLSSEDATLLCATTPQAQLQIGALCRFEGTPIRDAAGNLRIDDLRDHVSSRLHLLPRFRQRVRHVPLDLARPVWVDEVDLDLDRHLRSAALPPPGGDAELRTFVGGLLSRPLDPAHPLWDLWVIDGLDGGDVAVVLRTHHVVADGLSLLRAATALLDLEPAPPPVGPPPRWQPQVPPSPATLAVSGLADRARRQAGLVAATTSRLFDPRQVLHLARSVTGAMSSPPRPRPHVPLTGPVGRRRDFLWAQLPLDELREVAHAEAITLNDVVLAIVGLAVRRMLGTEVATHLAGRPPQVLVPVGGEAGAEGGNAFSFVVASLPVQLEDPVVAARAIHDEMRDRKASRQSADLRSLFSVIDVVPIGLLRRVAPPLLARQPFVDLAVTNLPGSPVPLHLLGARLRELQPIVTGVGNIACIIGVLSYCGHLGVGITVDPDVVCDADELLDALVHASDELVAAARR